MNFTNALKKANKNAPSRSLIVILGIAGLSMGNQSCQQPVAATRVLKMDVEVGSMKAKPVTLPTGETIDFPYVVNSLFYRQVMANDHFVIGNIIPSPSSTAAATAAAAQVRLEGVSAPAVETKSNDEQMLERYGFLDGIRAQAQSQLQSPLLQATATTPAAAPVMPQCLYDSPQAKMGGEMISFEATWGVGVGVGYTNSGSSLSGGVGGKVNISASQLQLGLRTDDPLTQQTDVISDGIANQMKMNFAVSFFAGVPLGLDFFFNSPLANVIKSAMDKGLVKMVTSYENQRSVNKSWSDVWESRVVYDPILVDNDTHIAFRGGYRAGIQIGDTFTVTNLHYMWEGDACSTPLKYRIPLTTTPVAEVQVVSVGDNVAVAVVSKYLIDQRILPGAQVKIMALKQPTPAKGAVVAQPAL
jgi:hypothetical protein